MAKEKLEKPRPIIHPLHVGNACWYWPKGVRQGDPKPAVMLNRENLTMIGVLEFMAGESKLRPNLRHVDDPFLAENPRARADGAWDYADGIMYPFLIPARLTRVLPPDLGVNIEDAMIVAHLVNVDRNITPGAISMKLGVSGLTADKVNTILTLAQTL